VLAGLTLILVAAGIWIAFHFRGSPERRELRRRQSVNRQGRLGDAMVTEATETTLYYSYSVRGVHYAASQDVTALRERLPAAPERLIGFASLKYSPRNPANSILICEEWSGLRAPGESAAQVKRTNRA
jgi:hypothetical protein